MLGGWGAWRLQSQGGSVRTQPLAMPESVTFRVLLGVTDAEPTDWSGSVVLTGGSVRSIKGWRFAQNDSTDYQSSWKLSTRRGIVRAAQKKGGNRAPMEDNGVLITASLDSPDARYEIRTPAGAFSFVARELPYGESKAVLDGRARVERVPGSLQLTTSAEEQDHPALAQRGDDLYLAYVDFTHGDRAQALPQQLQKEPANFAALARPTGGDQVKLMRYSKSKRVWSAAEAVSPTGQDVMRTAVAVDGSGRVWVVWSAQRDGNFDLFARVFEGGKWTAGEMRVTSNAGQDLNPVAATDSSGRVWIAWQAYRQGNLEILAAAQDGARFGAEQRVSFSAASDWDPSIAAAGQGGEVAIAWDTYDKGDYDVYARKLRWESPGGVKMDRPVAIAATGKFEARPSIGYDPRGRVWVAYEGSEVKWGKDFGAYETTGVALYQGHNIRVRCLEPNGSLSEPEDDVTDALPGGRQTRRRQPTDVAFPNPALAANRNASGTPQPPPLPKNSFPRLGVDGSGNVYLAYRTGTASRSPIGPIWHGQIVYFDGEQWRGPVEIPNADGLADIRAALVAPQANAMMLVTSTDHRQAAVPGGGRRGNEGINTDLYAAEIAPGAPAKPAKLRAVASATETAAAEAREEAEQVAKMRAYRVPLGGRNHQLLRGEFHRHTELSGDGGMSDGPIIDAYRYMIDAAAMDWGGCCDHDNGGGHEYYWWMSQKLTDAYHLAGRYTAMFSYERSVRYPEGHRNTVFPKRGLRPLPRLPKTADDSPSAPAPDTQMLYRFLKQYGGIVASHTSGTDMGTDWRDSDPLVEPVVEIYQGDRQNYEMPGAPRSNAQGDSIGGWRPLGFVSLALQKGYRLGFQASSDHVSTHMSYCNLWVAAPTREAVMEAFRKRRVYGATDNILADVRAGSHFMGEEFTAKEPPVISVKLWGTADFAKVQIIKDGQYAHTVEPKSRTVDFSWKDASPPERGKTSYYYVRGEQADGELVWVSPMWVTYE